MTGTLTVLPEGSVSPQAIIKVSACELPSEAIQRLSCGTLPVNSRIFVSSPSQLPCDGADGRQLVPGDSDGAGPREDVLPALPDAVWHQASSLGRHHTQGGESSCIFFFAAFRVQLLPLFTSTHSSPLGNSLLDSFLQLLEMQLPAKTAALLHLHTLSKTGQAKDVNNGLIWSVRVHNLCYCTFCKMNLALY